MIGRATAALAVLMMLLVVVPCADVSAEDGDDAVLLDLGNGETYWCDSTPGGSYVDAASAAASSLSLEFTASGSGISSIAGMSSHTVGGQSCGWILYIWDGDSWETGTSGSAEYTGGCFAWGFYPDPSISPTETPDSRTAWTMHRGDSSSSGVSDSYGTEAAVAPMEWYKTYTTGYVDSSIIVAGDYLYHTTGGMYGATGADKSPWVYCINRFTGELVWDYMMSYGQGYEVTSPMVVDDMLIVTATNWNVYCFDRYTGEMLHRLTLDQDFPLNADGDIAWEGRTFYTGATTPVYDSGAMYFGTADGHIMAYSITRDTGFKLLWDYDPDDSVTNGVYTGVKGCFYFHAPVIADVDGTRMLYIGGYEGYLYAINASTGAEVWVQRLINLGEDNRPHPGTPGSVGSISVTSDGRLLVDCSDGGLSSLTGYTICVDASTGRGPDGSDYYWKIDAMCGGPVLGDDCFYAYVSKSYTGSGTLEREDGTTMDITSAIYKFNLDGKVVWVTEDYQTIKAALTLANGVIYAVDYSAGEFYPSGGGLTAISADDGSEIWRLRLSPYSSGSYSMVSATVVDGKIYTGNDYGAIYCISEVAGPEYGDDGEIVLGNGLYHWSWLALVAVVAATFVFLIRFY